MTRASAGLLAVAIVVSSCGDRLTTFGPITATPSPPLTASAQPTPMTLADLIYTGRLRVAFNRLNITCVTEVNGRTSGLCMDIAREIASELRVVLNDQTFTAGDELWDAGRHGLWDIAFVAYIEGDPDQTGMTYSAPYLELDQTYVVAQGSRFRAVAELDAPGQRVAAFRPSVLHGFLSQHLRSATLVDATSFANGMRLIELGDVQAYAASRAELVDGTSRLGGGRILEGTITLIRWRVAVATGRADLLDYVNDFLAKAKQNGLLKSAVERNRVAGAAVLP